ncbi:bacterial transcriptional activator domain-containing protein [Cellulomonas sp. HZM]|uniref:bacterial transcriptional activator domain-containing protein n=1 Tax=Cellulomonas sp. HZM TaxID=1454010 RepID=UPI000689EDB1|nr:bacterial transcriptional activator domain-containing protein [Cellulomonas sp. HZM]
MSAQTDKKANSQEPERGPQRFQQTVDDLEVTRSRWGGIGALLALVVLLVGVPVGLVALGGVPHLPTSFPTREQLTGAIGVEQVVTVLVWVVWLAWLQFAVCVAVELRSAVRGIGLPTRVPLAGPSQRAARTLVAAVLLLVTAAGQANAVTHAVVDHAPAAQVAAVASVTPGQSAQEEAPAHAAPTAEHEVHRTYHLGDLTLDDDEGRELVGKRVIVVQPPDGRYHDNLWDIAERNLGEGRRYHDIYELNKGRDQPDGQELTLARLIQPGWLLVMPEDATDVSRVTVTEHVVTDGAGAADEATSDAAASTPVAQAPALEDAGSGVTGGDVVATASEQGSSTHDLAGAGLLAAGLLAAVVAVRRRRRTPEPGDDAVEMEVALRVGADPVRARRLDTGLRQLSAARATAGLELPPVYAASIDDAVLTVFLAPGDTKPPAPWTASDDGRQWHLAADASLPPVRGVAAPYPGLVSLGRSPAEADVLVDLEAAQGPVSIVGDEAAARELATAVAAELVTNGWSDVLRVTGVGLPAALEDIGGERYRAVQEAADVLPELSAQRADVLGSDVLAGRLRGRGAAAVPEYLVSGTPLAPDVAQRLAELSADGARAAWGAVVVGDVPGARWRIEVDADGALSIGPLGVLVTANRLSAAGVAAIGELVAPDELPDEPVGGVEVEGHLERPDLPPADRALGNADLWAAPVRVLVLGEPRVEAAGPIEDERRDLCTELVVHLALHPEGVHPTVLGAAVWPRGVTTAVVNATVARAREWLGKDAHGTPHLRHTIDGDLVLGARAVLDWDVFRSLLATSREARSRADEAAALREALGLVRGEAVQDVPPGRYSWLARARLERDARTLVVDAAHRLAVLELDGNDPEGARRAVAAGLGAAPTEELLWRDLLRAVSAEQGPQGVRAAADEMARELRDAGVREVSAPTAALVEELAPGVWSPDAPPSQQLSG